MVKTRNYKKNKNTSTRKVQSKRIEQKVSKYFTPFNKPSILNDFQLEFATLFLRLLMTIKMYHWNTYVYSQHKATDSLYESLNGHIDKFMEVLLGKQVSAEETTNRIDFKNMNLNIPYIGDRDQMLEFLVGYIGYLNTLEQNKKKEMSIVFMQDLLNIRDEILADLNQFIYLLSFNS